MAEEKDVLLAKDVNIVHINKQWPDWNPGHIWKLVKDQQVLHKYLPVEDMEQGCYPDRWFFWGVVSHLLPDWASAYTEAVMKKKHAHIVSQLNKTKIIKVSDKWR